MKQNFSNVPYIKEYKDGQLLNPINWAYLSEGDNRKTRRLKDARFMNNRKSYPIQVIGKRKYVKVLQRFTRKDGTTGIVKHYL